MSFSSKVKEELSKLNSLSNKELVEAELKGYLITINAINLENKIKFSTENEYNINRFHKLLSNLQINYNIQIQGKVYIITFENNLNEKYNNVNEYSKEAEKAIIRGAFLGSGSINEPKNNYHLEIILKDNNEAKYIKNILEKNNIQVKEMKRKKGYSIYIKEGEEISKFLAFTGATKSVLSYEEIRVVKETRNNINRLVNCETANLNKTINAAVGQIEAIKYLKKIKKFEGLQDNLKEIAELRLENPDATLAELGQMLKKPIGKSGVNHRLKKIQEIADVSFGDV